MKTTVAKYNCAPPPNSPWADGNQKVSDPRGIECHSEAKPKDLITERPRTRDSSPPAHSDIRWVSIRFFLLVFLFALPYRGESQNLPAVGRKPAPAIGAPANPFDLKTLDGKPVGLGTFRGKPLVINFFASWCDPCREEMPLLNQLASRSAKEGYAIVGIAVEDNRAALTQYVDEARIGFPVALDLNSTVKRAYHIFGPPATFFIDGKGVIRDMVIGPVTAARAQEGLKKARAAG
ncbi:MAG TPA: TlpA disulfide reductase family protein [Candidatus Binatia bacterium]